MATPISVADGSRMSPVPRSTEASVLTSQIETAPENSTCEYCSACSSTPPRPPSSMKNWRPNSSMTAVKNSPPSRPIMTACSASVAARSRSPAPMARLIADETPPPMAPADIICVSMTKGKTSAIAASGSMPRRPI